MGLGILNTKLLHSICLIDLSDGIIWGGDVWGKCQEDFVTKAKVNCQFLSFTFIIFVLNLAHLQIFRAL